MFNVEFYRLPDGRAPVEVFLNGLNTKMRNKALDSLLLLEEFGNNLREPYSKSMGDGLFELRIKFSSDIDLAKKYKADYESRMNLIRGESK